MRKNANKNSFLHLTLDERRIIEKGICNGSTKRAIAMTIGKDETTVAKEIRLHRYMSHKCSFALECKEYPYCRYYHRCKIDCPQYQPFKCNRRDRTPGACNGCPDFRSCRFNKFIYKPEKAQNEYQESLVDSRGGPNLSYEEAKKKADIIAPLLKQGLSPYQILKIHPELDMSEKTMYNYIEDGIFKEIAGITSMDLRRQVSRKLPKKKRNDFKKREDHKYLAGRTFKDLQTYLECEPHVFITQMDTIYNDQSGPFIQTFKFIDSGILFAILHSSKSAQDMLNGVNMLESILEPDVFRKYVHVLLTDRGTEFSLADAMETSSDDTRRTRVFYCDPMRADQKGSLENNHVLLRYVLPKGTNLYSLGLTSQDKLNLVLSHVNSAPVEKLGGKSPLETAEFMFNDLYQKLYDFGIRQIDKHQLILKPYLLK